eukprot:UN20005
MIIDVTFNLPFKSSIIPRNFLDPKIKVISFLEYPKTMQNSPSAALDSKFIYISFSQFDLKVVRLNMNFP